MIIHTASLFIPIPHNISLNNLLLLLKMLKNKLITTNQITSRMYFLLIFHNCCEFETKQYISFILLRLNERTLRGALQSLHQACTPIILRSRSRFIQAYTGPAVIVQNCLRFNFSFPSHKGHEIKASLFKNGNKCSDVCVVYLHSFNGSRL